MRLSQIKSSFLYRPVPFFAAGLGIGVTAGGLLTGNNLLDAGYVILAAGILAILAVIARLFKISALPLLLFALALGLVRAGLACPTRIPQPGSYRLSGQVAQPPEQNGDQWYVTLKNCTCDDFSLDAKVLLSLPQNAPVPQYGDMIRTAVVISHPETPGTGSFHEKLFYLGKGVSCFASAEDYILTGSGGSDVYRLLLQTRDIAAEAANKLFSEHSGLMRAMLLGDKSMIPQSTLADFQDTGVAHLLAVSGLHVSILAAAVLFLLQRGNARVAFGLLTLFLLLYCAITAFSPSVVRASLMLLYAQLALLLGRRRDPLTSICCAFIVILLAAPYQLFQVGFQLSFCAVLALILLYPMLQQHLPGPKPFSSALAVSLAAEAGTLPVVITCFGRFSLMTTVVNLLTVPLMSLIMVPGLIAELLYFIWPWGAQIAAIPSKLVLTLVESVTGLFAGIGTVEFPPFPLFATVLYFIGLFFFSRHHIASRRGRLYSGGTCILLSLLCTVFLS